MFDEELDVLFCGVETDDAQAVIQLVSADHPTTVHVYGLKVPLHNWKLWYDRLSMGFRYLSTTENYEMVHDLLTFGISQTPQLKIMK